jgi:hypothetical protein
MPRAGGGLAVTLAPQSQLQACRECLKRFFAQYPNVGREAESTRVLTELVAGGHALSGKAAGWAAGIVYAVSCTICGVPGVFNREMEEAFGVSMSTVYQRAADVRRAVPSAWPR